MSMYRFAPRPSVFVIKLLMLFFRLLRIEQWYKNLLVFAPLLFAGEYQVYAWPQLIWVFFGFCFISSVTYIANDWLDRDKDRHHPTKKKRPLASGKVSGTQALLVSILLLVAVIAIVIHLGLFFAGVIGTYFVLTNLYSFGLKNVPLLDILMIAFNFLLRMLAGMTVLPNINTLPYFGALFSFVLIFTTHKRRSDIKLLGKKAVSHKPVLKFYSKRNNYIFRAFGYLVLLVSFYQLWLEGMNLLNIAALLMLIIYTSFLFSEEPKLTMKPHYLVKNWVWDGLVLLQLLVSSCRFLV
jgi:decaprenyl-phosphate phosphoribosyltransferase